jgi:hypothetical protein
MLRRQSIPHAICASIGEEIVTRSCYWNGSRRFQSCTLAGGIAHGVQIIGHTRITGVATGYDWDLDWRTEDIW